MYVRCVCVWESGRGNHMIGPQVAKQWLSIVMNKKKIRLKESLMLLAQTQTCIVHPNVLEQTPNVRISVSGHAFCSRIFPVYYKLFSFMSCSCLQVSPALTLVCVTGPQRKIGTCCVPRRTTTHFPWSRLQ